MTPAQTSIVLDRILAPVGRSMTPDLARELIDLLAPVGRSMTPDLARELVGLRVDPEIQAKIDELAEKCNEGQLSADELTEYDSYIQAIYLIGSLQREARAVLKMGGPR